MLLGPEQAHRPIPAAEGLEGVEDRVRFLGAEGLSEARDWRTDKALASAVIDVFEKNTDNESYTNSLAEAVGRIPRFLENYRKRHSK